MIRPAARLRVPRAPDFQPTTLDPDREDDSGFAPTAVMERRRWPRLADASDAASDFGGLDTPAMRAAAGLPDASDGAAEGPASRPGDDFPSRDPSRFGPLARLLVCITSAVLVLAVLMPLLSRH